MTLLLDWLTREGHLVLAWWLWMTLAGLACLPLCLRLFGALPDRGYTIARALGLLLVTWTSWLLGSYGFLDNSRGSIALCWLLALSVSLAVYFRRGQSRVLSGWWRENRSAVIYAELLFAALFFGWALYRAHQNGLVGTEKPMELAFISSALRSNGFPPADPWMSGYAISYYYMGYVMSASLAKLSGISSAIAFNLTNASLFSLTGLAAFGVVYNLAKSPAAAVRNREPLSWRLQAGAIAAGSLATVMLVLMGNFQFALIEAPLQTRAAPKSYIQFWRTQKLPDFETSSYAQNATGLPSLETARWPHWWWFSASRVPTDFDLNDQLTAIQPIGEFPAFSFLLADNHPHVFSLPFVVAAIGLMLNIVVTPGPPSREATAVYGIVVGGLAFLNAWDAPTMLAGLAGAEALRRLMTNSHGRLTARDWLATATFGAKLALIALLAYLPYFVGLRSQAGGILPNLLHPSLFRHFFVMFGPLIVVLVIYLAVESWRGHRARRMNWRRGLALAGSLLAILLAIMTILGFALAVASAGAEIVGNLAVHDGDGDLASRLIQRRISYSLTAVLLLAAIATVIARLFPASRQAGNLGEVAVAWIKYPPATGFTFLLIGIGLCLTIFCEFFYLKDNFLARINTVFKLYYQAWTLWSVACAYAIYSLFLDRNLPKPHFLLQTVVAFATALAILAGAAYSGAALHHRGWIETGRHHAYQHNRIAPPASWGNAIRHVREGEVVAPGAILYSRVGLMDAEEADLLQADVGGIAIFDGNDLVVAEPLTLDGARGLLHVDDQRALECLQLAVASEDAVVAEAVGEAYNIAFGRVGAVTGIPVVLGWVNHQRQWRGATYGAIAGSRASDLRDLYTRAEMSDVRHIIERYAITHILYGATERRVYGSEGEAKFLDHLPVQCESGTSRIFFTGR